MKLMTRQAKSIARIRAQRRAAGQCADCGALSEKFRCAACRPPASKKQVSAARRAAARARWA